MKNYEKMWNGMKSELEDEIKRLKKEDEDAQNIEIVDKIEESDYKPKSPEEMMGELLNYIITKETLTTMQKFENNSEYDEVK